VFDFANPDLVTGSRPATNVPAQPLFLLNSPFVMEQSEKIESQIIGRFPNAEDERYIQESYLMILSRLPKSHEVSRARIFLKEANRPDSKMSPLAQLIQALFASTEFRMLN